MNFTPNNLFYAMAQKVSEYWNNDELLIICNEGGSRAGKTFDTFDLITWICDNQRNRLLDIYILRDTLINNRDYTLKDWKKLQRINGIKLNGKDTPKPEYNLFGNKIFFRGLEDEESTEGYPSDILFFNEALEIDKSQVDGLLMRCRKLAIFDWNPKLTKHWVFDFEGKNNVLFTRTTYKNNRHLEKSVIDTIESYNPEIEANVKNKTADLFRWRVYGLGLRTDQIGSIFNDSQLHKFDLKDIDLKNATKIGWCDVADQGDDWMCMVFGAIIRTNIYLFDVIFSPDPSEMTIPLIIDCIEKYDIDIAYFESNGMGLGFLKNLLKEIKLQNIIKLNNEGQTAIDDKMLTDWKKWVSRLKAIPNTSNKHSRIKIEAENNIIKNFYFLNHRTGMYSEFYSSLTSYKYDKSENSKIKDDAPDALAGLSKISNIYLK